MGQKIYGKDYRGPCRKNDCKKPAKTDGFCEAHYAKCAGAGCDKGQISRGLCMGHYQLLRRLEAAGLDATSARTQTLVHPLRSTVNHPASERLPGQVDLSEGHLLLLKVAAKAAGLSTKQQLAKIIEQWANDL